MKKLKTLNFSLEYIILHKVSVVSIEASNYLNGLNNVYSDYTLIISSQAIYIYVVCPYLYSFQLFTLKIVKEEHLCRREMERVYFHHFRH